MEKTTKYHHLTLEEREVLYKHKALGYSYRVIGEILSRRHTTLCREWRGKIPNALSIERKSRYIKLTRLQSKESIPYMTAQINQMQYLPVETITADNGLENVLHHIVSQQLKADYYFCHAYSNWEKGSVENVIKLMRRFIPKGADISKYTDEQIQQIEDFINNYPRKLHNFLTPKQILEMEGIKV